MISERFNPYFFQKTGSVQVTTRYDGAYNVDSSGNYYYETPYLNSDTYYNANFFANRNLIKYSDGFFFGLNESKKNFTEYQLAYKS